MKDLPIYPHLEGICDTLLNSPSRFLVLTAETAAGKSTTVPIALLPRLSGKIIMLEPRRIATVAIATRIAELLGESVGQTAGYRLHLDSKISAATRIEIITEAILTRRIQSDPQLSGISAVIIDEFHERSVHADLALALLKEIATLRDDLFVVVMSATIDTERIARYLGAPVVSVPGRQWPVTVQYAGHSSGQGFGSVEDSAARAVRERLSAPGGSILVFLPGIAEIRRTAERLAGIEEEVLLLHSSVSFEEQRRVLDNPLGTRRVILSSSIAETSITVPGVSIVIDSGLSRTNRFDIRTGMNRLVTETESVFSSIQRAGRAGRTGPGVCVRLWAEHDLRLTETPPEIERSDILPLVLECALWGVTEPLGIDWLDRPNAGAWAQARELLITLEALDETGHITGRGRRMASLGVHPRIAAVALTGNVDLAVRYSQLSGNPRDIPRFRSDLIRRIGSEADQASADSIESKRNPAMGLLAGFPDRIARHTGNGIYQFPSGRLASLPRDDRSASVRHPLWIVAPEADAGEREGRIWSYEPLPEESAVKWLERRAARISEVVFLDGKTGGGSGVKKTEYLMYGKLVLSERRVEPTGEDIARACCAHIRRVGSSALPWTEAARSFANRAGFWFRQKPDQSASPMDDTALLESLEEWLLPFIPSKGTISAEAFLDALRYRCDALSIDREVPSRITLPSGISRPVEYQELVPGNGPVPVLEIRIQDLFGCPETPRILGIPVLLRLLSPARRPLQITGDLAGFWKNTWPEVIKEMKGRYPKHKWPDDPLKPLAPR